LGTDVATGTDTDTLWPSAAAIPAADFLMPVAMVG